MKKTVLLGIITLLFFPLLVSADSRCPDYCSDGTLYTGRTYSIRAEECSSPTSRQACENGCDGRDKCAERIIAPTLAPTDVPRPTVTPTPVTPSSPQQRSCPSKCQDGVYYAEGSFVRESGSCVYALQQRCDLSECDRDGTLCNKILQPPTCEKYCTNGMQFFNGKPTASGKCIYDSKRCASGCLNANNKVCDMTFEIKPAHFFDPVDKKDKPIPEATVHMSWSYVNAEGATITEALSDRGTQLDGSVIVSQEELYKYAHKNDASLSVSVVLKDYQKRFEVRDKLSSLPNPTLERRLFVDSPSTHKIDLNFNANPNYRRDAKIYYHNWEAVHFSETVLGTAITSWAPEIININSSANCDACHSSSYNEKTGVAVDLGIDYKSPTKLYDSNSPENFEWHEFCHHIMMEEYGKMPPWGKPCGCGGSCNHCGYWNATSADSFMEGWAEFCALAIKSNYKYISPHVYAGFGSMEVDHDVLDNEEFAVASTLWDLFDSPTGDGIEVSIKEIWEVLRKQYIFKGETVPRHIQNFSDVHWAFSNSNLPLLDGDINNNGISNLNELFTKRWCYIDTNKNMKWNTPEPVGVTLWLNPKKQNKPPDVIRPNRPYKPGAYIGVFLSDSDGKQLPDMEAKIRVTFPNGICGSGEKCDYEYTLPVEDGKIYIEPPSSRLDAVVSVSIITSGKSIQLARFSAKEYWKKYDPNKEAVEKYTLKVKKIQTINETEIYLSEVMQKVNKAGVTISSSQLNETSYKISGFRQVKLFGLFPYAMQVEFIIDVKTGSILSLSKPWWGIFAF